MAEPKKRDAVERPAFIPEAVLRKRAKAKMEVDEDDTDEEEDMETEGDAVVPHSGTKQKKNKKRTERDIEVEMGDDYVLDLNKKFMLANDDEKYDVVPEHWHGHNIADYIDPDIMEKLTALEKAEEERERAGVYDSGVTVYLLVAIFYFLLSSMRLHNMRYVMTYFQFSLIISKTPTTMPSMKRSMSWPSGSAKRKS